MLVELYKNANRVFRITVSKGRVDARVWEQTPHRATKSGFNLTPSQAVQVGEALIEAGKEAEKASRPTVVKQRGRKHTISLAGEEQNDTEQPQLCQWH